MTMRFIIAVMDTTEPEPERQKSLNAILAFLRRLPQLIRDGWHADLVALRNWWRRQRGAQVDYVIMRVSGSLPERSPPPRSFFQRQLPFPPRPLTIEVLNERFQRIADARNVRGVVLVLGDFTMTGLARIQNLRRSLARLHDAGKDVIVYTPYLDLAHYYVATAAGTILAPPGAQFDVVGLQSEAVFLRDALERIGVRAEVLQVSPYKTAGNMFSESTITPEQRQQMEWLIDDTYEVIAGDLAQSRGLSVQDIKALIDAAPFTAEQALASRLIDILGYEDELPDILSKGTTEGGEPSASGSKTDSRDETANDNDVSLLTWEQARPLLLEKVRRPTRRYVGVISLDGLIVMGASRQPPVNLPIPLVGGAMAGEETLIQQLRRAEKDKSMAALILYVESGGGSALASELIWRQITLVARKKPVLAYMGDVAASGGYFVSAGAQHIMSQRSTVTGSIGVLLARMNPEELFDKLSINQVYISRGAHAGLYSEPRSLSPEEHKLLWNLMQDTYGQFKAVVAEGRNLEPQQVEEIAGGRVWTGRQARERHLVDSHGDFVAAVKMAARMADLPDDEETQIRVQNLHARTAKYVPPQAEDAAKLIADLFSAEQLRALNGRTLLLMPFDLRLV